MCFWGLIRVIHRAFVAFAVQQEALESMGMETLVYNRLAHGWENDYPLRPNCTVVGEIKLISQLDFV